KSLHRDIADARPRIRMLATGQLTDLFEVRVVLGSVGVVPDFIGVGPNAVRHVGAKLLHDVLRTDFTGSSPLLAHVEQAERSSLLGEGEEFTAPDAGEDAITVRIQDFTDIRGVVSNTQSRPNLRYDFCVGAHCLESLFEALEKVMTVGIV